MPLSMVLSWYEQKAVCILLTLLHLSPCLQAFAELCPWMGVARGVLVTAAVMAVTVFFTNRRLFWRT